MVDSEGQSSRCHFVVDHGELPCFPVDLVLTSLLVSTFVSVSRVSELRHNLMNSAEQHVHTVHTVLWCVELWKGTGVL
jgi:hypothetical protein